MTNFEWFIGFGKRKKKNINKSTYFSYLTNKIREPEDDCFLIDVMDVFDKFRDSFLTTTQGNSHTYIWNLLPEGHFVSEFWI